MQPATIMTALCPGGAYSVEEGKHILNRARKNAVCVKELSAVGKLPEQGRGLRVGLTYKNIHAAALAILALVTESSLPGSAQDGTDPSVAESCL